jgi:hypothetical protein
MEPTAFARPIGAPQHNEPSRGGQHDGLPDIAFRSGPARDGSMGGIVVNAKIVPFVPRLNRKQEPVHLMPAAFRSAPHPDDLTMDHADTAPC